ncbi:MAG TPA: cupin domain-containing protein [bacterium]|nr:cupin domain-containing protein [bacterium]
MDNPREFGNLATVKIVQLQDLRQFDSAKMRKNNLFETRRFFCDLYCLEAGQSQAAHVHEHEDKVMIVLEGEGTFRAGAQEVTLEAGEALLTEAGEIHGIMNEGPERLVCLVFMAPHPKPPA